MDEEIIEQIRKIGYVSVPENYECYQIISNTPNWVREYFKITGVRYSYDLLADLQYLIEQHGKDLVCDFEFLIKQHSHFTE